MNYFMYTLHININFEYRATASLATIVCIVT